MAEKLKKTKDVTGVQPSVLQSLVSAANSIQSDLSTKQGDMGAHVKKAEDVHGVHRKAFKQVCTLARMDEGKRSEYLRALDDYRDKLDLNPHPDMFADTDGGDGAETGEGDEEKRRRGQAAKAEQQDRAADNAAALKGGIKQLETAH